MTQLRRTKQRTSIQEAIRYAKRPLSPQEIRAAAEKAVPGLGMATVYRNIKTLVESGWLEVVELPGAADRYEIAGGEHHHHFHCRACDRVYDMEGCPGDLSELSPPGFTVESHEIILYGVCSKCAPT